AAPAGAVVDTAPVVVVVVCSVPAAGVMITSSLASDWIFGCTRRNQAMTTAAATTRARGTHLGRMASCTIVPDTTSGCSPASTTTSKGCDFGAPRRKRRVGRVVTSMNVAVSGSAEHLDGSTVN